MCCVRVCAIAGELRCEAGCRACPGRVVFGHAVVELDSSRCAWKLPGPVQCLAILGVRGVHVAGQHGGSRSPGRPGVAERVVLIMA